MKDPIEQAKEGFDRVPRCTGSGEAAICSLPWAGARVETGGPIYTSIDRAKEQAIRRDERERIIKILLKNQFCFMDMDVDCPGCSSDNCEACARKVLEGRT